MDAKSKRDAFLKSAENSDEKLVEDQETIRLWLENINETDDAQIKEVMDLMRTNPEYRLFILDYVK